MATQLAKSVAEDPDVVVLPRPEGVAGSSGGDSKRVARKWQRAAMKANPRLDSANLPSIPSSPGKDQDRDHGFVSIMSLARE